MFFSHDRLYEAAPEERGVLMGDAMVYGDDLAEGRFVRLFTETMMGNQFIMAVRPSPKRRALDRFVATSGTGRLTQRYFALKYSRMKRR